MRAKRQCRWFQNVTSSHDVFETPRTDFLTAERLVKTKTLPSGVYLLAQRGLPTPPAHTPHAVSILGVRGYLGDAQLAAKKPPRGVSRLHAPPGGVSTSKHHRHTASGPLPRQSPASVYSGMLPYLLSHQSPTAAWSVGLVLMYCSCTPSYRPTSETRVTFSQKRFFLFCGNRFVDTLMQQQRT